MTTGHRRTRRTSYRGRAREQAEAARPVAAPPALALPYAAQLQGDTTTVDLGLLAGARLRHDRIRWWWGERKLDGWAGAYCYLCDRPICSWDTRYPITQEAIQTILSVRAWHNAHGLAPHGIGPAAMSAAGNAPPVGGPS